MPCRAAQVAGLRVLLVGLTPAPPSPPLTRFGCGGRQPNRIWAARSFLGCEWSDLLTLLCSWHNSLNLQLAQLVGRQEDIFHVPQEEGVGNLLMNYELLGVQHCRKPL